jgi:hypothetical protein
MRKPFRFKLVTSDYSVYTFFCSRRALLWAALTGATVWNAKGTEKEYERDV